MTTSPSAARRQLRANINLADWRLRDAERRGDAVLAARRRHTLRLLLERWRARYPLRDIVAHLHADDEVAADQACAADDDQQPEPSHPVAER